MEIKRFCRETQRSNVVLWSVVCLPLLTTALPYARPHLGHIFSVTGLSTALAILIRDSLPRGHDLVRRPGLGILGLVP